ncbi:MFS transporter [Tsuneonella deserti]|uniref:MFS transporter n=1 Tax=Tsuneonella deserti TaxID=2035528 RepID=A0ABQ1S9S9_9SPHN|nr:MFS transporter [Tsuneonella deserti]GGE01088.1 MFS transporter [Tsuneonella deserti]
MAETDPPPTIGEASARPISRERLVLLFMVMLVTAAGNTAMQSVMPSIGTELGVADVWISLAYTWSALLWVICAPLWARRSDRRGRKAMMALGLIGFIASFALCGAILWFGLRGAISALATLLLFAAARSLYGGFGSAAPPAVQAYVASRTPRSERTQAMALIASSFGLGTVIGPAVAPLMVFPATGLPGPFFAFALLALAVLIALRISLPNDDPMFPTRSEVVGAPYGANSNPRVEDDEAREESENAVGGEDIPNLSWRDERLRPWLLAGLIGGHAQAAFLGIVGFFILDRLGLRDTPNEGTGPIGLVLMCGAIATLLAQWGLIPRLKLGPRSSTLWGMALSIVGVLVFAVSNELQAIALGMAIASLGFGLYRPGFTAGASLAVSRAEQGQIGGIVASVNGAAYVVAAPIGVWLYGHHAWIGFATICALCAAVFILGWQSLARDEVLEGPRQS